MDKEKLKELALLHAAATPGEWTVEIEEYEGDEDDGNIVGQITIHGLNRVIHDPEWADSDEWAQSVANSQWIAEAKNAFPDLLAYVRGLEEERDRWKAAYADLYSGEGGKSRDAQQRREGK